MKLALPTILALISLAAFHSIAVAEPRDPTGAASAEQVEFFEKHVRPILAEHCFSCHGPQKQRGGLRLDSRLAVIKGGDGGPVLDLKNPQVSRLLKAVGYEDAELQMPPPPDGKLPAAAIAALGRWIELGAIWPAEDAIAKPAKTGPTHWAFRPVRQHSVRQVRDTTWPRSPIDGFILAQLERQGMTPAPPADRATLARRASFDLVGLPPDEAEVTAFVDDAAPNALARLVDRLLDSPHYGERWGRYWLDVARYADTKGYVRLQEERRFQYAFTYRDYVIRAFNEDLPFDRFVVEQLAADQLPLNGDNRPLAALGFLTLGRQFTGNEHDIVDDRIDVVTRGLLGLTVSCARCHDHKYDPIPTADYYSLYGVFASSEDPIVPPLVGNPSAAPAEGAFGREFAARQQALEDYEPRQHAALVDELRAHSGDYLVQALAGRLPPQQPLPKAPGEIRQVVVDRWIEYLERRDPRDRVFGPWRQFAQLKSDEFSRGAATIIAGWSMSSSRERAEPVNEIVKNHLISHPPRSMAEVARAYGALLEEAQQRWQSLLASAMAAGRSAPGELDSADREELRQVLYAGDAPVAVSRQEALWQYLYDAPINEEIMRRRNAINEHLAQTSQAPPRAHTLIERQASRDPRIFARGNPTRPGRIVPRQFLEVLSLAGRQCFTAAAGRLELARAIASRDNPLTARVIVNRVWSHHFGTGLVRTPSNFGTRGQAPTHPELLDYLAARFMDEGWSIKKLNRWIMLSSVYQQSSQDRADYRLRDPENRLFWKMNRRRLDFEALRDSLLLAAGRLDRSVGGPSVDLNSLETGRRTVYGLIDRQELTHVLPTFDFASPDAHSGQRYTTTVPQQALFLMNSPLLTSLSRSFAERKELRDCPTPEERVGRMIRVAWGRPASAMEVRRALDFIERDRVAGANGADGDPANAWEALAQILLLANEFTYVD